MPTAYPQDPAAWLSTILVSQQVKNIAEPVRPIRFDARPTRRHGTVRNPAESASPSRQALHCGPSLHEHRAGTLSRSTSPTVWSRTSSPRCPASAGSSSSPETPPSSTRAKLSMYARSAGTSGSATSLRAPSGGRRTDPHRGSARRGRDWPPPLGRQVRRRARRHLRPAGPHCRAGGGCHRAEPQAGRSGAFKNQAHRKPDRL